MLPKSTVTSTTTNLSKKEESPPSSSVFSAKGDIPSSSDTVDNEKPVVNHLLESDVAYQDKIHALRETMEALEREKKATEMYVPREKQKIGHREIQDIDMTMTRLKRHTLLCSTCHMFLTKRTHITLCISTPYNR
jgi:hypothetical protein